MRNWSIIAARLERDGPMLTTIEAAKLIPASRGKATAPNTLVRWILFGRHGVHLDGIKGGCGWLTTKAALLRFLAACSEGVEARVPSGETLDDRERRARAAMARLRAS